MKPSHILCTVCCVSLLSCDASSESLDQDRVDQQQKVYAQTQPIPFFKWSQDRDNLIQIYKMKNEARATYAVVRSITGEILWHCPSIGFPIPADTQLTNPLQMEHYHGAVIEQAEPNGLFSSKHTDGTYVICVLPDGTLSPQYSESKVDTFTRPVKVVTVDGKDKITFLDGPASMIIERKRGE